MWFALFMIIILLVTGLVWLLDKLFWEKKRAAGDEDPVIVEYSKSFFPVILIVFVIRSFIVEPFKIPSGSMIPTLLVGDYILVNKYTYGIRVPILNNTVVEMDHPKHGDVVVFHYPPEPTTDYIKRVVGLPGDEIQYENKELIINGKAVSVDTVGQYEYLSTNLEVVKADKKIESLGEQDHELIVSNQPLPYPLNSYGYQLERGATIIVPEGHYFVMGDNRDRSADSRFWGFVPEGNLVGRAFFIWMNFDYLSKLFSDEGRIGQTIE